MVQRKTTPIMIKSRDAVENAKAEVECLRDELQEWFDNMPENFQNGDKGDQLQDAVNAIEEVISSLDEVEADELPEITEISFIPPHKKATSRAKRLENEMAAVERVIEALELHKAAVEEQEDAIAKLDEFITSLQAAVDNASSVEFPGVY